MCVCARARVRAFLFFCSQRTVSPPIGRSNWSLKQLPAAASASDFPSCHMVHSSAKWDEASAWRGIAAAGPTGATARDSASADLSRAIAALRNRVGRRCRHVQHEVRIGDATSLRERLAPPRGRTCSGGYRSTHARPIASLVAARQRQRQRAAAASGGSGGGGSERRRRRAATHRSGRRPGARRARRCYRIRVDSTRYSFLRQSRHQITRHVSLACDCVGCLRRRHRRCTPSCTSD